MPIDLYYVPGSPPCCYVRLVAAAVGVDLNLKYTNMVEGEHMKPEFLKINPQHTIPTLNDDGFYLCESRAICTYLVQQYGKDDSLYPKDPKQRALIDQRLYFDSGSLYQSFTDYYYPQVFAGAPADPAKFEKINQAIGYLEKFLEDQNYVTGKKLTVADLALAVTTSNFSTFDYDLNKYPNVSKWLKRIESEVPKYQEINGEGVKVFKEFIEKLKKKLIVYCPDYLKFSA